MITIVTPHILENLFLVLGVRCETQEPVLVKDYTFCQDLKGRFWLQKEPGAKTEALQVTLTAESGWRLEAFQSVLAYKSEAVTVSDGKLHILTDEEIGQLMETLAAEEKAFDPVYAFFRRDAVAAEENLLYDAAAMGDLLMKDRQLNRSDLYLMVPGKVKKEVWGKEPWEAFEDKDNEMFRFFHDHIDYNVRMEYEGNFLDELDRRCLGSVMIEIPNDYIEKGKFFQPATICVLTHTTGLCVLEILVNNCFIGGNKLLNYYRGNELLYHYGGKVYSLQQLMELFSIRSFGDSRSLVFAYGDVEKQAIINALANEEYPMGKIGGLFQKQVEEHNIALYDTAEVYVSPVTLIECCRTWDPVAMQLRNRLNYQVIEIFYVELLLFQDAAIDKVHKDLLKQQELQYDSSISKINMDRVEEINFDMARAIRFSDYTQFRFPTTRESARTVSSLFGMEQVFEKYEQNKELLDAMIKTNQRRISKRENKIKNGFLLLLSFVSTAKSVSGIIEALTNDNMTELVVYLCSIAIVAVVLSLNWLNDRRNDRKRKEKREGLK